jgi:hypothetical protein
MSIKASHSTIANAHFSFAVADGKRKKAETWSNGDGFWNAADARTDRTTSSFLDGVLEEQTFRAVSPLLVFLE